MCARMPQCWTKRTVHTKPSLTTRPASSMAFSSLMCATNTLPDLPSAPLSTATCTLCRYCAYHSGVPCTQRACQSMPLHERCRSAGLRFMEQTATS